MTTEDLDNIVLNKKTGFDIINPNVPVVILDERGMVFYDNSELKNRDRFNLPPGKYYIRSGDFLPLKKPNYYKLNKLPPTERNQEFPFNFEIKWGNNPHKATIDWSNKTILFDEGLKSLTKPELFFILFHEYAHAKYNSERLADRLAENMMLLYGFNPSQTGAAPITSLSNRQPERKYDAYKRNMRR